VLSVSLVGGLLYRRSSQPSDDQVVMRFERAGPFAQQDRGLVNYLAGSEPAPTGIATTAFCVNGWYWATDITLDLDVVVGSSDRLLRAAQLVADGSYPVGLVSAIESPALRALEPPPVGVAEVSESIVATYGVAMVRNYLVEAGEFPSAVARERFVLFAASETTTNQFIFVIDLTKLDRAAIGRFIDGPPLIGRSASAAVIAGTDKEVAVDDSMCHDLR
jgi:hypothetical protein